MLPETLVGVRYFVCIPAASTVTEAWLTLTSDQSKSGSAIARIRAERVIDSESFQTNPSLIGRSASDAEVPWTMPAFVQGNTYRTPDITSLINEIINLPGWTGCGDMLFVFEEVGKRNIVAFDGSPADAVVLNINTSP
jgi:type IV pilus assembly protein PilY1